jgi:hypothetical protein
MERFVLDGGVARSTQHFAAGCRAIFKHIDGAEMGDRLLQRRGQARPVEDVSRERRGLDALGLQLFDEPVQRIRPARQQSHLEPFATEAFRHRQPNSRTCAHHGEGFCHLIHPSHGELRAPP